jgi:TonB family protein
MEVSTSLLAFDGRESLRGTLLLSIALHSLLGVTAIFYTVAAPRFGGGWGRGWGAGRSVRVGTVTSLPGVPLPTPMLEGRSQLAVENPGIYKTEPQPQVEPPSTAQPIPKFKDSVRAERVRGVNKRIQDKELAAPENAVPFGLGGQPAMTRGQFVNTGGEGGLSFGEGGFEDRFGWYVAAVRNRISTNWLLSTISASIVTAPRVHITFDILRDGTVTNVEVPRSSGVPEVDRSALRAVLASNPLGPLPSDYSGSKVSVEFFFDFRRH